MFSSCRLLLVRFLLGRFSDIKRKIGEDCPYLVKEFNKHIDRVCLLDSLISRYKYYTEIQKSVRELLLSSHWPSSF